MASVLSLEVATPHGLELATEASEVELPGVQGEMGIFPGHIPVLTSLRAGVLRYVLDGQPRLAAVGSGFAEADARKVRLLTNRFVLGSAVSLEEANADLQKAEAALTEFANTAPDEGENEKDETEEGETEGGLKARQRAERKRKAQFDALQFQVDWARAQIQAAAE